MYLKDLTNCEIPGGIVLYADGTVFIRVRDDFETTHSWAIENRIIYLHETVQFLTGKTAIWIIE